MPVLYPPIIIFNAHDVVHSDTHNMYRRALNFLIYSECIAKQRTHTIVGQNWCLTQNTNAQMWDRAVSNAQS